MPQINTQGMNRYLSAIVAALALLCSAPALAQSLVVGTDFVTRFDNREYSANEFSESQTLFSARLSPRVGVEWGEGGKSRIILGVDLLQNFGHNDVFLSKVRPLMYYRFKSHNVEATAGIFDIKELAGDYPRAMVSDSMTFYENRLQGFMGRYTSTRRTNSYVELALDWCGMRYDQTARERFRILSAGRMAFGEKGVFNIGYALQLYHFAGSNTDRSVSDNLMLNPFIGTDFNAYLDFSIKAGALVAPQRLRQLKQGWKIPCGALVDIAISRWGVKIENELYIGDNLMTYYDVYGGGLYLGDNFYRTTKGIYNRTMVGYERKFFDDTLHIEAGMLFHYDGVGLGTSQLVKVAVDIEKLFNIGKKRAN